MHTHMTGKRKRPMELQALPNDALQQIMGALLQGELLSTKRPTSLHNLYAFATTCKRLYRVFQAFVWEHNLPAALSSDESRNREYFDCDECGARCTQGTPLSLMLRMSVPGTVMANVMDADTPCAHTAVRLARTIVRIAPRLRIAALRDNKQVAPSAAALLARARLLTRLRVDEPSQLFLLYASQSIRHTLRELHLTRVPYYSRASVAGAMHDLAERGHLTHITVRFAPVIAGGAFMALLGDPKRVDFQVDTIDDTDEDDGDDDSSRHTHPHSPELTPAKVVARAVKHPGAIAVHVRKAIRHGDGLRCTLCDVAGFEHTHICSGRVRRRRTLVQGMVKTLVRPCGAVRAACPPLYDGQSFLFRTYGFTARGIPKRRVGDTRMFDGLPVVHAELDRILYPRPNGPSFADWRHLRVIDVSCIACRNSQQQYGDEYVAALDGLGAEGESGARDELGENGEGIDFRLGPARRFNLVSLTRAVAVAAKDSLTTVTIPRADDGVKFSLLSIRLLNVLFSNAPLLRMLSVRVDVLVNAAMTDSLHNIARAVKGLHVLHVTTGTCSSNNDTVHRVNDLNIRQYDHSEYNDLDDSETSYIHARQKWQTIAPLFFSIWPQALRSFARCCDEMSAIVLHEAKPCKDDIPVAPDLLMQAHAALDEFYYAPKDVDVSTVRSTLAAWKMHGEERIETEMKSHPETDDECE